jgi:uncharacterized alkaline shock family protein YloU
MNTDGFDRGRTVVADAVVRKIAARAATDVDRATGSARRLFGIPVGRDPAASPARVDVEVDGDVAVIHVAMSVRWPASVRDVSRQVRAHVTEQVANLTGLTVAEVDIDVTALVGAAGPAPGRVG